MYCAMQTVSQLPTHAAVDVLHRPVQFISAMTAMLEAIALISAFVSALATPLDDREMEDADVERWHFLTVCCTQMVGMSTTGLSMLILIQLRFYKPEEMAYFCTKFGIIMCLPIVGMVIVLLGAMSAICLHAYAQSHESDPYVWKIVVGVMAFSSCGILIYPYMDYVMRGTRFAYLKSDHHRRDSQPAAINTASFGVFQN